jgi:AraC family transcriptional regulator
MHQTLRFGHGNFFGAVRRTQHRDGIALAHRIASGAVEPHTHSDAHFVWVTGGRYVSSAHGGPPERSATFVYNPPGVEHRDHFKGGKGSFFTISILPARLKEWCAVPPRDAFHIACPRVRGAAWELLLECREGVDSTLQVEALCAELFALIDVRQVDRMPPPWLSLAREVLHDRAEDDLTLGEVARAAGVHPIHFTRAFRQHFGSTPGDYLRRCRLERATDLLRRSALPLCDVALACGFADQSHFTRKFTKAFGVAPAEYRRLIA